MFTPRKKSCLDSNPVIWFFFDFGPSWHQITKFKVLSPLVIWENFGLPKFMKVQNQKSYFFYRG